MSRSRRRVQVAIVALLCLIAAEATARVYWRTAYLIPIRHPSLILYAFYPEIRFVDEQPPSRGGKYTNVLLLGGSVLTPDNGAVELALRERLSATGHRRVRFFNVAVPGHTSRDSWLKYRALADARFDLVIPYEGINDAVMNIAAPGQFRDDYGHVPFYEIVNAMAPYHRHAYFALPYTLRYLAIRARQTWAGQSAPAEGPHEIKSVGPFRRNMESILALAAERGDPVGLTTFATRVPANYSLAAFEAFRLDYVTHAYPLESWGRPDEVVAAVALHNQVVRQLAATHPQLRFVDEARLMDGPGPYFNDPCHLSVEGSIKFARHLADGMFRPVTE